MGRTRQIFDAAIAVARSVATIGSGIGEVGGYATARRRVACRINARPTDERVATGPADQHVIAIAAVQDIGVTVTDQNIVEVGTGQILDAVIAVARSVAAIGPGIGEVGGYATARRRVACRINARPTDERVTTGSADQHVIAIAAVQDIGVTVTDQNIVEVGTRQIFDAVIAVACRIAAIGPGIGKIGEQPSVCRGVARGIAAKAAIQNVAASAADQHVVAITAIQVVSEGIASQDICKGRTNQILDANIAVTRSIARISRAVGEIGDHAAVRCRVACRIDACATIEGIATRTADQHIVAIAAIQAVGIGITNQDIGKGRADEPFDARIAIASGIARIGGGVGQACGEAVARRAVAGDVVTRAAI